jgi:hypothetical protein
MQFKFQAANSNFPYHGYFLFRLPKSEVKSVLLQICSIPKRGDKRIGLLTEYKLRNEMGKWSWTISVGMWKQAGVTYSHTPPPNDGNH